VPGRQGVQREIEEIRKSKLYRPENHSRCT
jgi:hypothetical protein